MHRYRFLTISGYTLVELILVISIVGVIMVSVMPRWQGTATNVGYESQRLLNDIRYAQALSIMTGQRYRWVKTSVNSYQIQNSSGTPITLPLGGTTMNFSSGVIFGTLTNLPNNLLAFDSVGVPYTSASTPGTALASTASIPISASGQLFTVQITPQTGYGVVV